jgi:hypothetical protein
VGEPGRWPDELAQGLADDVHRALVVALAAAVDAAPRTGVDLPEALSRALVALAGDLGDVMALTTGADRASPSAALRAGATELVVMLAAPALASTDEPLAERARRAGHTLHRSRHDARAPEFCSCGWMEDLRARAAGAVGQGQAHLRRSLEVPGWA